VAHSSSCTLFIALIGIELGGLLVGGSQALLRLKMQIDGHPRCRVHSVMRSVRWSWSTAFAAPLELFIKCFVRQHRVTLIACTSTVQDMFGLSNPRQHKTGLPEQIWCASLQHHFINKRRRNSRSPRSPPCMGPCWLPHKIQPLTLIRPQRSLLPWLDHKTSCTERRHAATANEQQEKRAEVSPEDLQPTKRRKRGPHRRAWPLIAVPAAIAIAERL